MRFFYDCFPLSQPGVAERAARIHQAIVGLGREISELKQKLPRDNPAVSAPILARLEPLQMLLTTALQRYDAEQSKAAAAAAAK